MCIKGAAVCISLNSLPDDSQTHPDFTLFTSYFSSTFHNFCPPNSRRVKEQKTEELFGSEDFCCQVWQLSLNKWLMDLMHLDSISTVSSLPQWLTGLCVLGSLDLWL